MRCLAQASDELRFPWVEFFCDVGIGEHDDVRLLSAGNSRDLVCRILLLVELDNSKLFPSHFIPAAPTQRAVTI